MGAQVDWVAKTKTINASKDDITIVMKIDDPTIVVNGEQISLDVAPMIVESRTLVPIRAVAESLQADVRWEAGDVFQRGCEPTEAFLRR